MKNVLLVDDNRMILNSLSTFLRLSLKDCNVFEADSGDRAIEIMKTSSINLILTDLEMPNSGGYNVIEFAKKYHPSIPLMIMTGSWSLDLSILVQKTGAVHVIEKPFRYEDLADMTIKVLAGGNNTSTMTSPG